MGNYIITISRQYGSGGRIVGKKLAEQLGINFYDREIIATLTSRDGLSKEYIEEMEHTKPSGFLYNMYMNSFGGENILPMPEQIFVEESGIIKDIQAKESAIIIGRCSDYVLQDYDHVLNVFFSAPMDYRIEFAKNELGWGQIKNLEHHIKKLDRSREQYYYYFTGRHWGKAENYNLCIDGSMGVDACVDLLNYSKDVYLNAGK
ncbi:MAG: cytidylate kinase-like family protein [Clostridiales Family XIII bacterium]|jgi:cytidylate kinase|nr:cytidylate kinase-like family protein [Clostridiales Family XIII bacterium]